MNINNKNINLNEILQKIKNNSQLTEKDKNDLIFLKSVYNSQNDKLKIDIDLHSKITEEYINNIIKSFKNKNGEDLSPNTINQYINRNKNIKMWLIISNLIHNQSNKVKVNQIIKDIKNQSYIKNPRIEQNTSKSYGDIVLYKQIINNPQIRNLFHTNYVLNRFNQIAIETKKLKIQQQRDNVNFQKLKIDYIRFVNLVKKITTQKEVKISNSFITPSLDDKLLLSLYRHTPLRDDFGSVILTDEDLNDEEHNYYNITTSTLHLNKYKLTAFRVYGRKLYKYPPYINNLIKEKYNNGFRVLFGKSKSEFYKNPSLSKMFQRIMKKYIPNESNISINDIRKATISYYHKYKNIKSQEHLASIMLHSINTAEQIYQRKEYDD